MSCRHPSRLHAGGHGHLTVVGPAAGGGHRVWPRAGVAFLAALLLIGPGAAQASTEPVVAIQATEMIPEDQLLDVGIEVFDPGLPDKDDKKKEDKGVFPELRKSEARFLAFHLKGTLESTGNWGAVRVIPAGTGTTDVRITGRIDKSTGMDMTLFIEVVDSTGRLWKARSYKREAFAEVYDEDSVETGDPYQSVFNEIANDMLEARERRTEDDIRIIRAVSRLQFATDLAPEIYGGYLKTKRKGKIKIERLPAEGDPMMARIASIRERDHMFIDTLNEYYSSFYTQMGTPYGEWRKFSYEEEEHLRRQRKKAHKRMWLAGLLILGGMVLSSEGDGGVVEDVVSDAAVIGGVVALQSGIEKQKEAKIHVEALKELAASVDAEVTPLLVDVEGRTLRLEGSAETQYAEWRRLLADIFATETGLPVDPDDAAGTASVESAGGGSN